MSLPTPSRSVIVSQKVYERLLSVYPRSYRLDYGFPMAQLFRDQSRDAWTEARAWGLLALWLRVIPDLVRTSFLEHISAMKGKKSMTEKISGVTGPGPAPLKTFFGVAVVIFLLVFGVSALITFMLPESFASTARIKVEPSARSLASNNGPAGEAANFAHNPYFIQTEFEVIQSELVLGKVVESLNLNSEWGKRYAGGNKLKTSESLDILKSRLELRPVRNTSLVEVRAYNESPGEAARIANAVAEAYREYRQEQQRQLLAEGFQILTKQLKAQDAQVRDAQGELDRLRQELQVSDLDAAGTAPTPMMDADTLRKLEAMRIETEMQQAGMEKQLDQLGGTPKHQLREVLPTIIPDSTLQELFSQLNLAELSLDKLRRDYHSANPVVVSAEGQVKLLHQKIDDRMAGVMTALSNQVATLQAKRATLVAAVDETVTKAQQRAKRTQPYYEKKQQVEELRRFSSVLTMKLAAERVDAQLPKPALAEIVDRAIPGLRPVRPNKPLNLVLGAAAGCLLALLVGCGAALLVSLRRMSPPPGPLAAA